MTQHKPCPSNRKRLLPQILQALLTGNVYSRVYQYGLLVTFRGIFREITGGILSNVSKFTTEFTCVIVICTVATSRLLRSIVKFVFHICAFLEHNHGS